MSCIGCEFYREAPNMHWCQPGSHVDSNLRCPWSKGEEFRHSLVTRDQKIEWWHARAKEYQDARGREESRKKFRERVNQERTDPNVIAMRLRAAESCRMSRRFR